MAKIEAAPANVGVTTPEVDAGMIVGWVETYSRLRPVNATPFLSLIVASRGWLLFRFSGTRLAVVPAALSLIEVGGHVENTPAELAAFETFAVISVEPGCAAVATPLGSMLTIEAVWGVYCRCPAGQGMVVWFAPVPE